MQDQVKTRSEDFHESENCVVTLGGLRYYHEKLMKCIDAKLKLHDTGKTNCPNCGAVITSSKCEYCGTDFMLWAGICKNF